MKAPGVRVLTDDYEQWLAGVIDLVPSGLAAKHAAMAEGELPFLRGTYYLWLVRVGELAPHVLERPVVPIVGDLHVENFGTWRDRDQVRRWGVNDLDELATGAWLLDLLRLATSAVVAPHLHLEHDEICAELLSAYAAAEPGAAVDVTEPAAAHLAALVPEFQDPETFYAHLAEGATVRVPARVAAAAAGVAEPGWTPTWHEHQAGTGSLGHRRAVGVGPAADGTAHAREAKELGPGTAVWASRHVRLPPRRTDLYRRVEAAVRGPAGATRVESWQVRDLAPDVVRIELSGLPRHHERHLLRSMARALADVHGADPEQARTARADAATMEPKEVGELVRRMAESTRGDLASWRKPHPDR
jgi:hypothetical protein